MKKSRFEIDKLNIELAVRNKQIADLEDRIDRIRNKVNELRDEKHRINEDIEIGLGLLRQYSRELVEKEMEYEKFLDENEIY